MITILLADDEDNLRLLVKTTLEGPERTILEAADGNMALDLAVRHQPDVIVLDWMMPGLSGIEVAHALQKDPHTARIPIIMLTARAQHKDRQMGFAAGAKSFLSKPFSPLELLEKIESICAETEVGK